MNGWVVLAKNYEDVDILGVFTSLDAAKLVADAFVTGRKRDGPPDEGEWFRGNDGRGYNMLIRLCPIDEVKA